MAEVFLFYALAGVIIWSLFQRNKLVQLQRRVSALEDAVTPVSAAETVSEPIALEPVVPIRVAAKATPRRVAAVISRSANPAPVWDAPEEITPEAAFKNPLAGASFEDLIGGKLPIWIGGIALVFAGFFLVRYTIEAGLLGPGARSILATLFALTLIALSEFGGRLPKIGESFTADPRVAQSLAGAGVATLYGTLYMASEIYGLIGVATAFLLVIIVTAIAFVLALLVAAAFGAAMGAAIHYLSVPSFIVTLAGMFLARGAAQVMSPDSLAIKHQFYTAISGAYYKLPGGGRLSLIGGVMVLTFVVGAVLAHRTRFGSYVYALGGNTTSAALRGVPVARTTVLIYTLSSTLAGLAGIVFSLYTSAGYSLAAVGVELDAISAVVIGGTLLTGGYGFIAGTFVGVLLMGLVQTYIIFDGTLSSWWTKIVIGVLLFMFILLQRLVFRAQSKRA